MPEERKACPGGCPEGETSRAVPAGESLSAEVKATAPTGAFPSRDALRRPVTAREIQGITEAMRELGVGPVFPEVERAHPGVSAEIRPAAARPSVEPMTVLESAAPAGLAMFTLADAAVDLSMAQVSERVRFEFQDPEDPWGREKHFRTYVLPWEPPPWSRPPQNHVHHRFKPECKIVVKEKARAG